MTWPIQPGAQVMSSGAGAPALVLMPDPEARVPRGERVFGVSLGARLADEALRSGFAAVYLAPGATGCDLVDVQAVATGDRVDAAALVAYETAAVDPAALRRLVAASADHEGSLCDELGRPVAWWTSRLLRVPAAVPAAVLLAGDGAPEPDQVARLIDPGDRPRVEALLLRVAAAELPCAPASPRSPWRRWFELPLLRWLVRRPRPPGRLEVAALLLAALSGVPALLETRLGLVLAAGLLLAGVQLAALVPEMTKLLGPDRAGRSGWLTPAIQPFGHASLASALTYGLVASPVRTGVADLVLLVLGGAAVLLSLAHARAVLRGRAAALFELPTAEGFAAQLAVSLPSWLQTPVRSEILVLLLAFVGAPGLPWGVLVGVGLARLWRWFIGHPDARAA
jgi:hypothetical protein